MLLYYLPSCTILDLFDHPVGSLLILLDLMVLDVHFLLDLLGYCLFLSALVLDLFGMSFGLLDLLCRLLMALFGLVFSSLLLFVDLCLGLGSFGGLLFSLISVFAILLALLISSFFSFSSRIRLLLDAVGLLLGGIISISLGSSVGVGFLSGGI